VALRPERIVIAEERGENRAEGVIEEVIYVGEATKFRIRVGTDRYLTVKQPSRLETMRWQRGDRVTLSWRTEDAVIVRAQR